MASLRMTLVCAILSMAYLTTANDYTIKIAKTLFNGDSAPPERSTSIVLSEKENALRIAFDFNSIDVEVLNTTVYLANKQKEILALTFGRQTVVHTRYITPYLENDDGSQTIENNQIQPGSAYYDVDYSLIPKDITAVSASYIVFAVDKEIIYNYYGIKNYHISLPDRLIVESYMPVIFPKTASEIPEEPEV